MSDYRPKITYRPPREALGHYLANLGLPSDRWETHFSEEQKEYWFKKADLILEYIRRNGLTGAPK